MFKESLFSFFSSQVNRFEKAFLITGKFDNETAIHDARVCIKKMKTVFTLIDRLHIEGLNSAEILKKNIGFYKILGSLRETNKQIEIIAELEKTNAVPYDEYKSFLKKNERKNKKQLEKTDFHDIIRNFKKMQQLVLDKIDLLDDTFVVNETIQFINTEFQYINVYKNNLNDIENWHNIRKSIKNIMYMMNIVIDSHYNSEVYDDYILMLDDLQESIGNWHDEIVTFDMLSAFMKKNRKLDADQLFKYKELLSKLG